MLAVFDYLMSFKAYSNIVHPSSRNWEAPLVFFSLTTLSFLSLTWKECP